jgi:hypothetical protein
MFLDNIDYVLKCKNIYNIVCYKMVCECSTGNNVCVTMERAA